jgi:hypothetical protein
MKILLLLFLLSSCVKVVDQASFRLNLNNEDEETVLTLCKELDHIGSVQEHFMLLNHYSLSLIELVDNFEEGLDDDFYHLNSQIQEQVEILRSLLDERFSTSYWDYSVEWYVGREEFKKFLGLYLPHGFKLTRIDKVAATFFGERNDFLLSNLDVQFDKQSLKATYHGHGSALEICQLQKTRHLLLRTNYRHLGRDKKRYFNLIHR